MADNRPLWHLGIVTSAERAESIVDAFRTGVEIRAAMVAPWDRPASADSVGTRVADSLWGDLLGEQAQCRWRCEGDRVLVSIVSELDLGPTFPLVRDAVQTTRTPLAPVQQFWRGTGGAPEATWIYRRADGESFTRAEPPL